MQQTKNELKQNFLKVDLTDVQFKRKFHYFLTVQWSVTQEKKRTEVSSLIQNPVFRKNNFLFPIPQQNFQLGSLIINAFIATDKENTTVDIKGRAKFLGEFVLQLQNFSASLTDIQNGGVFLPCKLQRDNKLVGKFFLSIKYTNDNQHTDYLQQKEELDKQIDMTIKENQFEMNLLPKNFFAQDTKYRIRINIYQALFLFDKQPANTIEEQPSFQCKCFLKYKNKKINTHEELTKLISNNENPIFNKQFLLNVKTESLNDCILIIEFDNYNDENQNEIFQFNLNDLKPFQVVNLQAKGCYIKNQFGSRFYFSFVLEQLQEDLALIVIKHIDIQPKLEQNIRFIIGLDFDQNQFIEFQSVQNQGKEILLKDFQSQNQYLSTLLKNPTMDIDNYHGGIAYFVLPFKMLKNKFTINLYLEMYADKNTLEEKFSQQNPKVNYLLLQQFAQQELFIYNRQFQIGSQLDLFEETLQISQQENIISQELQNSFLNKTIKIQIGCKKLLKSDLQKKNVQEVIKEEEVLKQQNLSDAELKLLSDNLKTALEVSNDREKWKILSKEVSQKQDLISRFVQEYDQKQNNLKISINHIIELKQQIKYLENEKDQIIKQLQLEEEVQLKFQVKKELENMNVEELRLKLIRVAQQYKDERNRNIQFEQTLQRAHQDLLNARQLQKEFDELSVQNLTKNQELMKMNKEISKIEMFQNTIEKQDLVIQKLEQNLEKCVLRTEKYQKVLQQIQTIEQENQKLNKQIKEETMIFESSQDMNQLQKEVQNLEQIKLKLQNELERNYPIEQDQQDETNEQIQLEIELQKYEQRVKALEEEIFNQNKKHAEEMNNMDNLLLEISQ